LAIEQFCPRGREWGHRRGERRKLSFLDYSSGALTLHSGLLSVIPDD
jgi:hypothetical protein